MLIEQLSDEGVDLHAFGLCRARERVSNIGVQMHRQNELRIGPIELTAHPLREIDLGMSSSSLVGGFGLALIGCILTANAASVRNLGVLAGLPGAPR